MPKKPTDVFGALVFSKDGKVHREIRRLPDDKRCQEMAVIELFIERYNQSQKVQIERDYVELEESNHDFQITTNGNTVIVQLTEIVERDYVIDKGAARTPDAKEGIIRFKVGATRQQEVDISKRNRALETAITRKVQKRYAKPNHEFWLLVFTTDTGFFPEIADAAFEEVKAPLEYARGYLESVDTVFDQVWFINLYQGMPLLVWDGSP